MNTLTIGFVVLVALIGESAACGGFFCSLSTPVVQEGENILFSMKDKKITAAIQIAYQGDAEDFSWVVPLPAEPNSLGVSSDAVFSALHQFTDPTFRMEIKHPEGCARPDNCERFLPTADASGGGGVPKDEPTVDILQEGEVGPFTFIVIAAKAADTEGEALFQWLNDNGFDQPNAAASIVSRYVGLKHVFLTLKLKKGKESGELVPIVINYDSPSDFDMSCIPLRLTAIAAGDNMPVFAWIAGDSPAIPHNYLHLTPNFDALPWAQCANSQNFGWFGGFGFGPSFGAPSACTREYQQLLQDTAADKGIFKWLTTEFLDDMPEPMLDQIWIEDQNRFVQADAADESEPEEFLEYLLGNLRFDLRQSPITQEILKEFMPRPASVSSECDSDQSFYQPFGDCLSKYVDDFDSVSAAKAVEERLIEPLREARENLKQFSTLTRFYTALSAKDMDRDPIFRFVESEGVEKVSREHVATLKYECPTTTDGEFTAQLTGPAGTVQTIDGVKVNGVCGGLVFPGTPGEVPPTDPILLAKGVVEVLSVAENGRMERLVLEGDDIKTTDDKFVDDVIGTLPTCNAGSKNCRCLSGQCMAGLVCGGDSMCVVGSAPSSDTGVTLSIATFAVVSSVLVAMI